MTPTTRYKLWAAVALLPAISRPGLLGVLAGETGRRGQPRLVRMSLPNTSFPIFVRVVGDDSRARQNSSSRGRAPSADHSVPQPVNQPTGGGRNELESRVSPAEEGDESHEEVQMPSGSSGTSGSCCVRAAVGSETSADPASAAPRTFPQPGPASYHGPLSLQSTTVPSEGAHSNANKNQVAHGYDDSGGNAALESLAGRFTAHQGGCAPPAVCGTTDTQGRPVGTGSNCFPAAESLSPASSGRSDAAQPLLATHPLYTVRKPHGTVSGTDRTIEGTSRQHLTIRLAPTGRQGLRSSTSSPRGHRLTSSVSNTSSYARGRRCRRAFLIFSFGLALLVAVALLSLTTVNSILRSAAATINSTQLASATTNFTQSANATAISTRHTFVTPIIVLFCVYFLAWLFLLLTFPRRAHTS